MTVLLRSPSPLMLLPALLALLCLSSRLRPTRALLPSLRPYAARHRSASASVASRSPLFVLHAVEMRTRSQRSREQEAWDSIETVLGPRRSREQEAWDSISVNGGVAQKNGAAARLVLSVANKTSIANAGIDDASFGPPNLDAMRARAGVLRSNILKQQMELQELERQINCCSAPSGPVSIIADLLEEEHPLQSAVEHAGRTVTTLASSTNVLLRKLGRVHRKLGPQNQRWENVGDFVTHQSKTAGRIVKSLVDNPERLTHLVDPETPTLVPHVPAILARLDRLEDHVAPILERVLNNRRHLASVEPYLPEILERFDDIEPHLPWILDNIDALAPYTGLLLKHIDELLLYADVDEHESSLEEEGTQYDLAEQLLPYLEYYVSKLDVVGPHLPLLRPHVPLLLKHNRLARVSPHIDRLFARGYKDLSASANMDVLLFWFGWSLRVPGLPKLFFWLPWSPRIVSFLANHMPKRFVRGYCSGVSCYVDGSYGSQWNKLEKS